ncbi:MAG: hypothetical protein ACXABY_09895, partial [Candidatus Thorarchaeota archaeon]
MASMSDIINRAKYAYHNRGGMSGSERKALLIASILKGIQATMQGAVNVSNQFLLAERQEWMGERHKWARGEEAHRDLLRPLEVASAKQRAQALGLQIETGEENLEAIRRDKATLAMTDAARKLQTAM